MHSCTITIRQLFFNYLVIAEFSNLLSINMKNWSNGNVRLFNGVLKHNNAIIMTNKTTIYKTLQWVITQKG